SSITCVAAPASPPASASAPTAPRLKAPKPPRIGVFFKRLESRGCFVRGSFAFGGCRKPRFFGVFHRISAKSPNLLRFFEPSPPLSCGKYRKIGLFIYSLPRGKIPWPQPQK